MMYDVLVYVPVAYADTNTTEEGLVFAVDNRVTNVQNIVSNGIVKEAPKLFKSILKEGDRIFFHYNIIRKTFGINDKQLPNKYEIDKNKGLYRCPLSEIFGIERDGEFQAIDPYCYIKPIKEDEYYIDKNGFYIPNESADVEQFGILKYSNSELRSKAMNDGDIIAFELDSNPTYMINGERLYKIRTPRIICKAEVD